MIRIAFCDDKHEVISYMDTLMIKMEIGSRLDWDLFTSGEELLSYLKKTDKTFHIYVLDIEMPGLNGIDIARNIRKSDKNAVIIFLTDYKEYVYQVFEVLPFRFLQKPVEMKLLEQTLNEAICHIRQSQTLFFFQVGHEEFQIPFGEIIYFEGAGRKIVLHTLSESIEFYGKLNETWNQLNHELFTRSHASFLINMEYIRTIRQNELLVFNNISIPVSKRYRGQVKRDHMLFVERRNGTV